MAELVYRVFVTRKMVVTDDYKSLHQAEGERIQQMMKNPSMLGVLILNDEFQIDISRIKRLERLLSSVFSETVQILC